jgi:hypothetical protein
MISYGLFDNGKLLIIRFSGIIDKMYIISFLEHIFSIVNPSSLSKVLCDFRESEIQFSHHDIKEFVNIQDVYSKDLFKVKEILLVKNPKNTMLATLFSINLKNWILLVCSTVSFCIQQFSLNMTEQELENTIEDLEYKFFRK